MSEVATVQASRSSHMEWIDEAPPAGHTLYAIRRDCVDIRFRHVTEASPWPSARGRFGNLIARLRMIEGGACVIEAEGLEDGTVDLSLFDVSGRSVAIAKDVMSEHGRVTWPMSVAKSMDTPGMYFLSVADAMGRRVGVAKLVRLP